MPGRKLVLSSEIDLPTMLKPELTGDDQANLWGFFPGVTDADMPFVARIDKATGALDRMFPLPQLQGMARDWAFAAWGSDFYIFLERNMIDPSTKIYKLDSLGGTLTTAVANTGRHIVGVGVATCASDTDGD